MADTQIHKTSDHSTSALVLGIVGIFAALIPILGLPIQVIGIVLGTLSLKSDHHQRAVAAVLLCIIGIFLSIVSAIIGYNMALHRTY